MIAFATCKEKATHRQSRIFRLPSSLSSRSAPSCHTYNTLAKQYCTVSRTCCTPITHWLNSNVLCRVRVGNLGLNHHSHIVF